MQSEPQAVLEDRFGRVVDYLRLSVTDRCDFRCVYCMAEDMRFLPRQQLLTLEEMAFLGQAFVSLGVKRIRLTGGEPLVRKNVMSLIGNLGSLRGLDELTLTTNGSQLRNTAPALAAAGVRRINISLDSLHPERFSAITRTGKLPQVLSSIEAAQQAGIERIKLNSVIVRGQNDDEVVALVEFALARSLDISFIEEMPLGDVGCRDRQGGLVTSEEIRQRIGDYYPLLASTESTAGPSRYYRIAGSTSRIGFISPHSHNFCDSCNRVRVTCEGRLLLCLGNEHSVDLRAVIRRYPQDMPALQNAIVNAMALKPERHYFYHDDKPQVLRFMNATGG
ncbi:GTP 3',8-cyclase MoaA [Porticoccus sp.]|jgi:cyclic pyranopterin phosphate synthase|uniref:GTP 3',8-cyclase MoaA n=1 Tax=Porticoccus sp. TaxID=2024853 RepID=UPI000C698CA3|nr:GTP 3',8-cyclase MoaA [Porticoccus sp.]MAZ71111.1 GTP 3',8-cyclase MoaA [Porticoccus sp.]|tara:strand:- start:90 stop:1094 length:1005 start_codon:yes stop_codon:yes gene_type:complete